VKGKHDPNARSVPLSTPARVEKIIKNFREHMSVQHAKRQVTIECGLFDVFFVPPAPSEDFQDATCFALREVLSSKLDAAAYTSRILVTAEFGTLGPNVLGSAGPTALCQYNGAGMFYPSSLLQLQGANSSCYPIQLPSIQMNFNENVDWYLGLDGDVPNSQFDFVTVASHELTHGLGFLSAVDLTETTAEYNLPELYFIDSTITPAIPVSDDLLLFTWAVTAKEFTYSSFDDTTNNYPNQGVYSPSPAEPGSSVSHFILNIDDEAPATCEALDFPLCNSLMRPSLANGVSIHRMGGNVMNALSNMGYEFFDCTAVTDRETCLGDDSDDGPRCDWCRSDSFCTDITLIDDIWIETCTDNDFEFAEKKRIEDDAASSVQSIF